MNFLEIVKKSSSNKEENTIEELFLKDVEYKVHKKKIQITKYTGQERKIAIPSKVKGKIISTIGSEAFSNLEFLEEISIPETIDTIYQGAFKGCTSLKEIELPEALTVLNAEVFYGCTNLEKVGLPYDLERICQSAFENCSGLIEFYHYSKRGISAVMVTDRALREAQLPTLIDYIGANAFKGCESLTELTLPYRVTTIKEGTFQNCSSLEKIHIHNRLKVVKTQAFLGCQSLKKIRLPLLLKNIAENAFESTTTIVAEKIAYAFEYAEKNKLLTKIVTKLDQMPKLSSQMVNYGDGEWIPLDEYQPFYNVEEAQAMVEKYEMRSPSYELVTRPSLQSRNPVKAARYEFREGKYFKKEKTADNRARIMMTGDLMSRYRQQSLVFKDGTYNFEDSFWFVRDLLAQSDFTIGNMESMISPSAPLTVESEHINNRPHLNAPESFLGAIRNANFDAVVNAQNHVYDTGTLGILETLNMHNKYQLMHTGAYVSSSDKRYILVEINNIKVALLAYFDGARQLMKKANFTKIGRKTLLNIYSKEQVQEDVRNAKEEGAEFIIAYCHWGREYTHELTLRQKQFARETANAGVDYIFGAHSHCVQPYDEIKTVDGRRVPVIYSGGNFLADINIKPPITRDTLIAEITIIKDEDGKVHIEKNGYYPCRIMKLGEREEKKNYAVIPTNVSFKGRPVKTGALRDAEHRIEKVLGSKIKKLRPENIQLDISLSRSPFDFDQAEDNPLLTTDFICHALGVPCPEEKRTYRSFRHAQRAGNNDVAFLIGYGRDSNEEELADLAIERGATLLISKKQIKDYPCLVIKDKKIVAWTKLSAAYRELFDVQTVGITGSIGKTTTKDFMVAALGGKENRSIKFSSGNLNMWSTAGRIIQELKDTHKFYVQEISEASGPQDQDHAATVSKMIMPKVSVLTKISEAHMSVFGTIENITRAVFGIKDGMTEDSPLVINADDLYQIDYKVEGKIITYGIINEDADYRAINIRSNYDVENAGIEFDVVYEDICLPLHINFFGEHNIYGALAAFATARALGFSATDIQKNLLTAEPEGIRSNLVNISDYTLYLDCYNASKDSTKAALKTLTLLENKKQEFRRVAVLGNIAGTSPDADEIHQNVGRMISESNIDIFISYGKAARVIADIVRTNKAIKVINISDLKDAKKRLSHIIKPNDIILFKGNRSDELEQVVNGVFDTDFK